ncbi:MAG TPA: hypothetical protein DCW35_02800 [Polynucleobacter sp.]|nr:hypothetical protein [Polynucleobacter sp.]
MHSHIINPFAQHPSKVHKDVSGSFSIIATKCVYADALTKVLVLSNDEHHPYFSHFGAQSLRITI